MCTVLAGEVHLPPGAERSVWVLFGSVDATDPEALRERVAALRETCPAPGAAEEHLGRLEEHWARILRLPAVQTPSRAVDVFSNVWHKHGALLTSRYVRGGHKGYRDLLQDIMGTCPLDVDWTRRWRGALYDLHVENPDQVECGVVELTIDGTKVEGNELPALLEPGGHHVLHCRLEPGGSRPSNHCTQPPAPISPEA